MMQTHELGISPLDRGPAFQGTGADVCIDIWNHASRISPDFSAFLGSILLFLKLYYE